MIGDADHLGLRGPRVAGRLRLLGRIAADAVVRQRFCLILRRCAVGQVVEKVALFTFVWACHAESPRR